LRRTWARTGSLALEFAADSSRWTRPSRMQSCSRAATAAASVRARCPLQVLMPLS